MQSQTQQQQSQQQFQTQKQSHEERGAIILAWETSKFFPAGLLMTDSNINQLKFALDRIPVLSISSIVEVVQRLGNLRTGGVLEYFSQPEKVIEYREKEKTSAEIARDRREFLAKMAIVQDAASWKADPADLARKAKESIATRQSAAQDRANDKARKETEAKSLGYSCFRNDRLNHAATNIRRAALRKIQTVHNGQVDWIRTRDLVTEAIRKFPD